MSGSAGGGRLMLLDTAALYFRAFFALPDSIRDPEGHPVNAVRGLLDIVARLVTEFEPTELVACWDDDWRPAWRVELVPEYKAHRVAQPAAAGRGPIEEVPDLLSPQVPRIREVLGALGVAVVGASGYEADDVIGTLAARASGPVDVVTSDRDLFQVVDDARGVRVVSTARGMSKLELVTESFLTEKYGITGAQYAGFAALRGDPSDGLPGVSGIGEKTAAGLLREFGSLAGVLEAAQSSPADVPLSPSVRSKLKAGAEYLQRAMPVVEVARDIDLAPFEARIALPDDAEERLADLSKRWGLGGSADRALAALRAAAAAPDPAG